MLKFLIKPTHILKKEQNMKNILSVIFIALFGIYIFSANDFGQKFNDYELRHGTFLAGEEKKANRLIEIGMRRATNIRKYDLHHKQYIGQKATDVAEFADGITTVAIYGVAGVAISIVATPIVAATVVGLGSGIQMWFSKADEYAVSYVVETDDYALAGYDKTNDMLAFGYGLCISLLVFGISLLLLNALKNTNLYKRLRGKKVERTPKKAKTKEFKIEIVNNKQYIDSKKSDRIKYLRNLKKQTSTELDKKRSELEAENKKLKDVPVDVAKYIKTKDTSNLKHDISKLEDKIVAIDELITAEMTQK